MSSYSILGSAFLAILLVCLKFRYNLKNGGNRVKGTDAMKIAQISFGIPICLEFLAIVILSHSSDEFAFFKPYSVQFIYTLIIISVVSGNNLMTIKI